ncbi:hypothetical protein DMB44_05445 [Thermoplasma sp. Kam2015]|uniref:hypothetical protein n=1 Tax=Thermoplasma sp. Kam2015 TaxID=2094122 RepID=UPI000D8523C9|nr:hypothetical protein [Thermoplasma sp. Kam2015]PYB68166.1 hypothetical protein DMB44_05445 [Thermoplasma sp. Kam2015]
MIRVATDYQIDDIPVGTWGTVVDTDMNDMGDITAYLVQWDIPVPPGAEPRTTWFTADEFTTILEVFER